MKLPIYLDYAATTPVDPRVVEAMASCLTREGTFGNPASRGHIYGWQAEEAVENAREQVAALIKADPREIVWTSGATESNNLAIKGVAEAFSAKGRHIITSSIEHKAVLDCCEYLSSKGAEITYLQPDESGRIQIEQLETAIRQDTILVSLMHVNNEIGTVNDLCALGEICRARSVLFHVDAAQSLGKIDIDVQSMPVDLMSFSAHKLYGPKGSGALFVRRSPRVNVSAQIHGGGHERGRRSGTLATHQIAGFGKACEIASNELRNESVRIESLRQKLLGGIEAIEATKVNGGGEQAPGILNVSFGGVDGEALLVAMKDIAVSSGSACTSASLEPSHVLREIGVSDQLAQSSIRFSIGRYTTNKEIEKAIEQMRIAVERLRSISSEWQKRSK